MREREKERKKERKREREREYCSSSNSEAEHSSLEKSCTCHVLHRTFIVLSLTVG